MLGAVDAVSQGDPRAWLSGPALDLYEHLDALGEIDRLKQIPQLGAVAWVNPQVEQTRWDYVELVLRLAARIAPLDSLFEDFGKVEIEGHTVGAGRDLLQCWAMLINYGHLWGSVATERLILDALAAPGKARDLFLEGLSTDADRAYARWVIDHCLVYKMDIPLATGFLHLLPDHREAPGRAMWLAMLRAFCEHGLYGHKII